MRFNIDKLVVAQLQRKTQASMKSEVSFDLSCSQETFIDPRPVSDEFSPHRYNP